MFALHVQGLSSNHSLQTTEACQVPRTQPAYELPKCLGERSMSKAANCAGFPQELVGAKRGNGNSREDRNCGRDRAKHVAEELARQRRPEAVHAPHTSSGLGRLPHSLPLQPTRECLAFVTRHWHPIFQAHQPSQWAECRMQWSKLSEPFAAPPPFQTLSSPGSPLINPAPSGKVCPPQL